MLKVTFKIDGKEVSTDRIGNALEQALYKEIKEDITKKLSSVRCPEHRQSPKVTVIGSSIKNLKFEVHGCCQKLIDLVTQKLK